MARYWPQLLKKTTMITPFMSKLPVQHTPSPSTRSAPRLPLCWKATRQMHNMGLSVASAGDVNGDGYSDVIVGANLYDNGETDEGAAFIYHGSATGSAPQQPSYGRKSNQSNAQMGHSVASAGDVNGMGTAMSS
jgi:hypothetical protein